MMSFGLLMMNSGEPMTGKRNCCRMGGSWDMDGFAEE
jgi:hypothetical protein